MKRTLAQCVRHVFGKWKWWWTTQKMFALSKKFWFSVVKKSWHILILLLLRVESNTKTHFLYCLLFVICDVDFCKRHTRDSKEYCLVGKFFKNFSSESWTRTRDFVVLFKGAAFHFKTPRELSTKQKVFFLACLVFSTLNFLGAFLFTNLFLGWAHLTHKSWQWGRFFFLDFLKL